MALIHRTPFFGNAKQLFTRVRVWRGRACFGAKLERERAERGECSALKSSS